MGDKIKKSHSDSLQLTSGEHTSAHSGKLFVKLLAEEQDMIDELTVFRVVSHEDIDCSCTHILIQRDRHIPFATYHLPPTTKHLTLYTTHLTLDAEHLTPNT